MMLFSQMMNESHKHSYTIIYNNFNKNYTMSIDNQTVKKVSKLAKIRINEKEETKLIVELNNILGWVDELKKVDTEQIEPMLSVFNESMIMRKDKVSSEMSDKLVLKNAPKSKSGFFVVPKVIE